MGRLRQLANEDGQAIVLGMVLLVGLFSIFAVALDVGASWTQRRNMQNVADAAALAGAQALDGTAGGADDAEAVALEYVTKNVSNLADAPTITFNEGVWTEITVVVAKESPSFFLANFGIGDHDLAARATARIASPLYGGPGVVPLAVAQEAIEYGTSVAIKVRAQNSNTGNFGFIDFGSGANDLCNFIREGSDTPVTDPQDSEPGNVSSIRNTGCLPRRLTAARANACLTFQETVEVIDGREYVRPECNPLDGAGLGSFPDYADTQPTAIIVVPVITTWEGCNGHCALDVVGEGTALREFAFFLVDESTVFGSNPTCRQGGQNQCLITGRFIEFHYAPVSTRYDLPTGEYDPNLALLKIVQLIE